MGEALGIDLRVDACVAARWRDGVVEPCTLGEDGAAEVPTAELMAEAGGGPTRVVDAVEATRGVLATVAERALGGGTVEAIGVTYALTPDDGPRQLAEQAASAAFGPVLLVPRVVAAVACFRHGGGDADGEVAVLDVDGRDVEVAVVRSGREGFDVLGTARVAAPSIDDVDMAAHFNEAVSALEAVLAGTVGGNQGVQAVVAQGSSEWLDQLAVQVRVATGLEVSVDPRPTLAAAVGAALVAGGPGERGRERIAGAAAVLGPAAVPLAQSLTAPEAGAAGAEAGAAVGDALAGSGEAGSAIGAHLRDARGNGDAVGDAVGEAVGEGLAGKTSGDGAFGDAVGEAVGEGLAGKSAGGGLRRAKDGPGAPPGGALGEVVGKAAPHGGLAGAALGAAGRSRRRPGRRVAVCAAAAVAALLAVGGLAAFGGDGDGSGGPGEVETAGARRTSTTRARSDREPDRGTATTTSVGTPDTTVADGTPDAAPTGAGSTSTVPGAAPPVAPGAPGPSGGTAPTTPTGPGDPPPPTAPTAPPDTTGPSVSALGLTTGVINESGFEFCQAPFTSTATATITDASGVASVAITWSGNGDDGAASMTASGSTWSGTLGPVSDNPGLAYGQSATITWTVTALDALGNATSVTGPSLTVQGC